MARRRRKMAVKFDTSIVMDVGIAGLATRIIPQVVNQFLPLDPTLYSVAGAGGTFLIGSMMKKPVLANAGIALGLVELAAPLVEGIIGNIGGVPVAPVGAPVVKTGKLPVKKEVTMADPMYLAEYTNSPMVQTSSMYKSSY